MPYSREVLDSLVTEQNVLDIEEIRAVLQQAENLEELEEKKRNIRPKTLSALKTAESNHKQLSKQLKRLENEKEKIDNQFYTKKDRLEALRQLAQKIRVDSTGGDRIDEEKKKIAKEILYIIDYAEDSEEFLLDRRQFLTAISATGIGLSKFANLDQKAYSDFNHAANKVAFEAMGVNGSTDPKEFYNRVENPVTVDKAVKREPVKVAVYNLGIGNQDVPNYSADHIKQEVEKWFAEGLDINIDINFQNEIIEDKKLDSSNHLSSELRDVSLKKMSEKELSKLDKLSRVIVGEVRGNEQVSCIITDLGLGYFEPRGIGASKVVLMDRAREDVITYLLAHELGHSFCLPHNYGTDVMSYSPERFLKGELGRLNTAFGKESRKNWEIIKNLHKSKE